MVLLVRFLQLLLELLELLVPLVALCFPELLRFRKLPVHLVTLVVLRYLENLELPWLLVTLGNPVDRHFLELQSLLLPLVPLELLVHQQSLGLLEIRQHLDHLGLLVDPSPLEPLTDLELLLLLVLLVDLLPLVSLVVRQHPEVLAPLEVLWHLGHL